MAKSEITQCLLKIDIFRNALTFGLSSDQKLLFIYCLMQGAKNNLGIFCENRGSISFTLGIKHEIVHDFFLTQPELIGFDEKTHFIWVKPIYEFIDFGTAGEVMVNKKIEVTKEGKKVKETKTVINWEAVKRKNKFVDKVKAGFRETPALEAFRKEWVKYNFILLSRLNEEVHSIKDNGRSLDELLKSY